MGVRPFPETGEKQREREGGREMKDRVRTKEREIKGEEARKR